MSALSGFLRSLPDALANIMLRREPRLSVSLALLLFLLLSFSRFPCLGTSTALRSLLNLATPNESLVLFEGVSCDSLNKL